MERKTKGIEIIEIHGKENRTVKEYRGRGE